MSIDVEFKVEPEAAAPVTSYDRVLKAVHWTSLLLVIAAYVAVWMSHAAASREQSATREGGDFLNSGTLNSRSLLNLSSAMSRLPQCRPGRAEVR